MKSKKLALPALKRSVSHAAVGLALLGGGLQATQTRAQDNVLQAEEIVIEGSQVQLTPPYAGGQVATGGRAGLLGNLDFLDSPFNGTAYTSELIENQQADSIGEVLLNDPTVRVASGFGNFQELYIIRGFPVFSDDITLNGVYGVLPRQFVAAEFVERVEIFRGVNAFINGAAPGDSAVGGTVNLVPKRAPEEGIRSLTLGWESDAQFTSALDYGQRFGENKEWGIRVNGVGRLGESSVENADRRLGAGFVGVDYDGVDFRFSADLGYQDTSLEDPRPQITPSGAIPNPPDADLNYAQPWTFSDERQLFFATRGEYDFNDNITAWIGGGFRSGSEENRLSNPTVDPAGNLTATRFDNTREDLVLSGDTGIRAEFDTGPIGHRVVVSGSATRVNFKTAFAFSDFFNPFSAGTLNNPVAVAPPPANFFLGGDLSNPLTTERTLTASIGFADTLSFFDDYVQLTLGGRYQRISTEAFNATGGALASEYSDSAFTPAVGLVVQPLPELSLYANYAEALQQGEVAPNVSGATIILNGGQVLESFRSKQFEIGAKFDLGEIGGSLAFFSITQQQAIVENQLFLAGGEQRNRGVELSLFGEPIEGVRVLGGFTYVDAELQNTQGGLNEGNTAIGVPKFQANLGAEWDVPFVDGLSVNGRLIFTGEQFADAGNQFTVDSWTRLDLGVRYATEIAGKDVTFRAKVENVANSSYYASVGGFPGANYLVQGEPRTFIATANIKF